MDHISKELNDYFERMGRLRMLRDQQKEGMIQRLLMLLPPGHDQVFAALYGLFGMTRQSPVDIARAHGLTEEQLTQLVEHDLRQIAVTPEWQMIKPQ